MNQSTRYLPLGLAVALAFSGCEVVHVHGASPVVVPSPPPEPMVIPAAPPAELTLPPRRPFTPHASRVGGGRIDVRKWDVGGGNWLRPWAKITAFVHDRRARRLALYRITADGFDELECQNVRNGTFVSFRQRYPSGGTRGLCLILYCGRGRILDVYRR